MNYWFDYPTKKTLPHGQSSGKSTYKAYLAKNEYENIQFVISSDRPVDDLALELSDFCDNSKNALDAQILFLHYIETKKGELYPDPASPLTSRFSLGAGKNQAFLIKIKSKKDTPAGEYSATLTLKASGESLLSAKIYAKVWDFALPDEPSCTTFVELRKPIMQKFHNKKSDEELDCLYKKYYDFLLDNKISAAMLPYDLLSDKADEYINDPRVTSFVIPYEEGKIKEYYAKLSKNPQGLKKGVFYPLDEPTEKENYDKLMALHDKIEADFPEYRIVTPFYRNPKFDENTDAVDLMTGKINVWCPKSYMFDNINIYESGKKISEAPFAGRMRGRKAAGDEIWWYVCWEPGAPFCNLFVDMPGILHRLLFWQQKLYEVDGFLYWAANYWNEVDDPWSDMRTIKSLTTLFKADDVFGDGSLLYNGNKIGIDGPVGSLRLENIRDGIEDFEYLDIAQKLFGKEFAEQCIKNLVTSLTEYDADDEKLMAMRIELGNKIEKYLEA